jgi:tight adherence protein C
MDISAQHLRLLTLIAAFVTVALLAFGLAAAPTQPGNRLGLRGLKRQRALAKNGPWTRVEPLVRWLGVRVSGLLSPQLRQRIDRQISLAGDVLGLTAEEFLALSGLSLIGGAVLAVAAAERFGVSVNFALMMLVPAGAFVPYLQISGIAQDRLTSVSRGLPFAIDLLAMAMSAGLDFPGAVRQVVDKAPNAEDPTIEELSLLLQGLQIGRSRREVLEELSRRAPCDLVLEFTGAVIQAEQRGNPLGEVLQIQAATYRTRRSVNAEEAAAKAGVKMTGPLFLAFVSVLLIVVGPLVVKIMNPS